jgi:hypothetical protein
MPGPEPTKRHLLIRISEQLKNVRERRSPIRERLPSPARSGSAGLVLPLNPKVDQKMSDIIENGSRMVNDTSAQVRRLRSEVESLMRETVTPAITNAIERAVSTSQYTTKAVRENSEAVAEHVRGRPLISIILAAGAGFIFGRASR